MGSASEEVHWSPPLDAVACVANAGDSSSPGAALSVETCRACGASFTTTADADFCPPCADDNRGFGVWYDLRRWLGSRNGDWFVDAAVLGEALASDAEDLLHDYGIPATRENLRALGRLVDAVIQS